MTDDDLAYACLEYLGEFSLILVEHAAAQEAIRRAIALAINQATQQIYELNPGIFKREVGVTVNAPISGTVTVSQGQAPLAGTTFNPSTLNGNSIAVAGQTETNAIRTRGGAAGSELLFPYTGTSGVKAATLYGDAILLDPAYSRPLGPVWLSDIRILKPLAGKHEMLGYDPRQSLDSDWGFRTSGTNRSPAPRQIGQPEAYFVDTHLHTYDLTTNVGIFLTPIPDRQFSLRFDAAVRPPLVFAVDSFTGHSLFSFGMPAGLDERFLLPLVLYYWTRSAFFKNAEARKQIREDYATLLPEIEGWTVQPETGGSMVTTGWRPRR